MMDRRGFFKRLAAIGLVAAAPKTIIDMYTPIRLAAYNTVHINAPHPEGHDDLAVLQAIADAQDGNVTIYLPAGIFYHTEPLWINGHGRPVHIIGGHYRSCFGLPPEANTHA